MDVTSVAKVSVSSVPRSVCSAEKDNWDKSEEDRFSSSSGDTEADSVRSEVVPELGCPRPVLKFEAGPTVDVTGLSCSSDSAELSPILDEVASSRASDALSCSSDSVELNSSVLDVTSELKGVVKLASLETDSELNSPSYEVVPSVEFSSLAVES